MLNWFRRKPEPAAEVRFKRLTTTAQLPVYATPGAAGMDLIADHDAEVWPAQVELISTGWAIAVPDGYEAQVRPRSGLAVKHGVMVINSPGTIDCDYRGELKVALTGMGPNIFKIKRGDRIAQLVVVKLPAVAVTEVEELDDTARGAGGFGSTGR